MVSMREYAERRQILMQRIGATSIAILASATDKVRNGDNIFPFRQDSNFYYLTGFTEPEAVAIIMPKGQDGEYLLFNRPHDPKQESWSGPRAGHDGALQHFLADAAFPISELATRLPLLLSGREIIYYAFGTQPILDQLLLTCLHNMRSAYQRGARMPVTIQDVTVLLHDMRLVKSPTEIAVLRQAVDISVAGHLRAIESCHPGTNQSELAAILLHEFYRRKAHAVAYPPIVGSGATANILHYTENNAVIQAGDLVLMDAGAEYQYYAADITRTFPANGHFSSEQRDIYHVVLAAQLAAIALIKPGVAWPAMQQTVLQVLVQGLIDLRILRGQVDTLIATKAYLPFYMHQAGHWLGLDVHDVGTYYQHEQQNHRVLVPNMVLTVEPGLYFSADTPGLDARWHHINVRIEDDVVVTTDGCEVLSQALPKTISDIEQVMAHGNI